MTGLRAVSMIRSSHILMKALFPIQLCNPKLLGLKTERSCLLDKIGSRHFCMNKEGIPIRVAFKDEDELCRFEENLQVRRSDIWFTVPGILRRMRQIAGIILTSFKLIWSKRKPCNAILFIVRRT